MTVDVQQQQVDAKWRAFLNSEEKQRIEVLDERIERRKTILAETTAERKKMMATAIKRMRRAKP